MHSKQSFHELGKSRVNLFTFMDGWFAKAGVVNPKHQNISSIYVHWSKGQYPWGRIEGRPELSKFGPIVSLDFIKSGPRALY